MSRRNRRTLSLFALAVLLTAQVAPALEVCVCEMPGVVACCQTRAATAPAAVPEEAAQPSGCCASAADASLVSMSLLDARIAEAQIHR